MDKRKVKYMVVNDGAAAWSESAPYFLFSPTGTKQELQEALLAKLEHQGRAALFLQDSDGDFAYWDEPIALPTSGTARVKVVLSTGQQQEVVSFWAKSYREKLQALPAPSRFGALWSAFQYPQGNLLDEEEFDRHGPLLNIYRPSGAKGLPAAFANAAFGTFLDQKRSGKFTTEACQTVLRLISAMSAGYINTTSNTKELKPIFGPQFVGTSPGTEQALLSKVREELLRYFQVAMTPDVRFLTLEPSLASMDSQAETDGSGGLQLDSRASSIHVFIAEGKEEWGDGDSSNPVMQLAAHYARVLQAIWDSSFVRNTVLPAVGLEVCGQGLRVHALFYTDKICCEPLTEWLHFADLRDGQPDYMLYLVRTVQSLGVLVNSLCMELTAEHQPQQLRTARNQQLTQGIPYMLRNDSHDIQLLQKGKYVYHVEPPTGRSWIAKVVAAPHPCQLHRELSDLGLAPKLIAPVQEYPGGVQVIKMEYLDPEDGWTMLDSFTGDWDALHEAAMEALKLLQSCLGGEAVHGDLNPSNVLVREPKPHGGLEPAERPQVMFLDVAWGGRQGQVTYPPFVNGKTVTTVEQPDGQLILRNHDTEQFKDTLQRCSERQKRQAGTSLLHRASLNTCVCNRTVRLSALGRMLRRKQANCALKSLFKPALGQVVFSKN